MQYRGDLIKFCYSTLESKQWIIDNFHLKYPDCSKKSIERVLKEIVVKEEREGDLRPCYYATNEILEELNLNSEETAEELNQLAINRMAPLVEEAEAIRKKAAEE